ncbi:MAG: glycosyltransferase family 2 protein [Limisphaerales bacterium]
MMPPADGGLEGRPSTPPRVSVVLPVFNALATLPRAVASVRAQTFADWELVAVDDGSTDGSGEWLAQAAKEEPRLRVLRRPHMGLVPTLNDGLAAARGEFVARMDADDECLPDRLAAQVEMLEANPSFGVAGCLVEFAGDRAAQAGYAAHADWLNSLVTLEQIALGRFIESPHAHPSVMFRRDLATRRGGYRDGPFPEDYELWLRWLEAGVRMAKVPRVLLRWHDPPGRLSRTDARYAPAAFFRLKAPFLARWLRAHAAGRTVWVAGAGRLTRRRVELIGAEGVRVAGFVDVNPRRLGVARDGRRIIAWEKLPPPGEVFLLGYVANRGVRGPQREFLAARGWREGVDFLFAA